MSGSGAGAPIMQQESLLKIIEKNADGMMVVDGAGIVRFANTAAGELFGRDHADLVDAPFGFPVVSAEISEIEIVHRGEERSAELRTVDIEWDGAEAHLVSLRDITDRKRAAQRERELAIEQAHRADAEERVERERLLSRLSGALETSPELAPNMEALCRLCGDGFADWCAVDVMRDGAVERQSCSDADGEILIATLDAVHRDRPVVEPLPDRIIRELESRVGGRWQGAHVLRVPISSRGEPRGALTMLRKDGRSFSPEDVDIARELGRRVGVSFEHSRLFEQARQASRAKSDFLAVMSHELRTPLNAIMGYADLLLMGVVDGELTAEQNAKLDKIRSSSRHLLELVNQILTFTRVEGGQEELHLQETRLAEFLAETSDMVTPMADAAGLEFRRDLPENGTVLVTDLQKARQILANLLTNAVKYTPSGHVLLRARVRDDWLHIAVEDTGIGMTPEQVERAFEPFWQADPASTRQHGGTGLGLSVAQRLATLLDGRLWLESEPGRGTTFRFDLPLRHPEA